jgi:uncharacterized protein (DUF2235 family)
VAAANRQAAEMALPVLSPTYMRAELGAAPGCIRVTTYRSASGMKHIIVALDGTWRAAYADPFVSNVYRMNLAFDYRDKKENSQQFIYVSGVGTYGKNSWLWGGALGEGLDQLILGAYINLLSNYEAGDNIYLFGFSRGAVAARALSGMIAFAGLLYPDQSPLVDSAWRYYLDLPLDFDFGEMKREATHDNVTIKFLGVWDTVYGTNTEYLVENKRFNKLRMRSLALDSNVTTGVQILAMDETRRAFSPLLWNRSRKGQFCEQIWMPGVHTDVGGGYRGGLLSEISLLSMIAKLAEHCPDLNFDPSYIEEVVMRNIASAEQIVINNEWKGYLGSILDRHICREVRSDVTTQSLHPVANLIADQSVNYKGKDRPYKSVLKTSSSGPLTCTSLDRSVIDWNRVDDLILQKF